LHARVLRRSVLSARRTVFLGGRTAELSRSKIRRDGISTRFCVSGPAEP
jgi:hypothetical protein